MSDSVVSTVASTDATPPILAGERVALTGTLASMTHRQAAALIEKFGGVTTQHVGQQTTLLVVGEEGWPLEADGRISVKLEHARQLQQRGHALRIVPESEWRHALGLEDTGTTARRLFTPAMLSQLLRIPVVTIRRWERLGLIRSAKRIYRLPYFDFRDVAGARRLAELLNAGVSLDEIRGSLERLKELLPGVDRPLEQLELLASNHELLFRDPHGLVEPETGQRVLDFDPPTTVPQSSEPGELGAESSSLLKFSAGGSASGHAARSADQWYEEGIRLAEAHETGAAIEAFRLSLVEDPTQSQVHFHLADVLYRAGNPYGAIERYYAAVELDHDLIEAWTQLGCVLAEVGQTQSAMEALRVALDRHADYPDAHFHLAELLERQGDSPAARPHWFRYLEHDQRGPWAEVARRRLGLHEDVSDAAANSRELADGRDSGSVTEG